MNVPSHVVIELPSPLGVLRLRPERDEDDAFRFALFCQSRPAELALLPIEPAAQQQLMRFQYRAQATSYRTNFPAARFDIIECDGSPIGRLVIDRAAGHIAIIDWAIAPQLRGRGIGTAIMQAVIEEARQSGREVRLKVASGNVAALRLYLRLGFVAVSTIPFYTELTWNSDGLPATDKPR